MVLIELPDSTIARANPAPQVTLGDGLAGLFALYPGSVDLVLSDLPSGETNAPTDRKPSLPRLWQAIWHALGEDGVAVLMASSLRFGSELQRSQDQYFRYDLIWEKSTATGFLNAKLQPLRNHEFILVFSKKPTVTTYHPQMRGGFKPITRYARKEGAGRNYNRFNKLSASRHGATDRYPRSVLKFASVGTASSARVHHQQKPEELLRYLIRSYSRPGVLVVDPFAGSGSTLRAAIAEGRHALGWDTDPRYGS
jgi:site-specific DNA-methyltransferase (adenine-specific)